MKKLLITIIAALMLTGCNLFKKELKNFDYDISSDSNCVTITIKGCPE